MVYEASRIREVEGAMNVYQGNQALTRFVHSVTRGDRCAQLVRDGDRYVLRRILVPGWIDPAYGVSQRDPRNVRIVEELPARSLAEAAEAFQVWEQAYGSMPAVAFRQGHKGCAWVLLDGELNPIRKGARSERFACIV
jgi:hypothetical protein